MLWRDVRFGFRTLIKSPAFTAAAVLSLALGIGVNTTIFTVINTLFLNPLPVDRASDLVAVYTVDANNGTSPLSNLLQVSFPNYKDYRDTNGVFSSLAAYSFSMPTSLANGGEPEQCFVELVTGNYFQTLGVKPARGRFFGPDEDKAPGASPVLVLSYGVWQRRFGSGDVVGKSVTVNGTPFTIMGVAPEGFHGVNAIFGPDGWAPTMMYPVVLPSTFKSWMDERRALLFNVAGRLKPGVSIEQAPIERDDDREDTGRDLSRAEHGTVSRAAAAHGSDDLPRHARRARPRRHGPDGHRRPRAAHRLLERGEPAARSGQRAEPGDRRAARARRQSGAARAAAAHRERAARLDRRCPGPAGGRLEPAADFWRRGRRSLAQNFVEFQLWTPTS